MADHLADGRTPDGEGGHQFALGGQPTASTGDSFGQLGYDVGRDGEKAVRSALLDALWQREPQRIEAEVLIALRDAAREADATLRDETAATRVNFFTMVRGDD